MWRIFVSPKSLILLLAGSLATLALQYMYQNFDIQPAFYFRRTLPETRSVGLTLRIPSDLQTNAISSPMPSVTTSAVATTITNTFQGTQLPPTTQQVVLPQPKVYRWNGSAWEEQVAFCSGNYSFRRITLKTPHGNTPMFVHEDKDDMYVSASLERYGAWEGNNAKIITDDLQDNPGTGLVDLGAQLGTYTLIVAKMGRHVVAVDPLLENVLRLCKSAQEGGLAELITILYVALSDMYGTVTFKRYPGNIGGTSVEKSNPGRDVKNPNVIETTLLDDIIPFVKSSRIFIKMDVEGHEYEVLKQGSRFLKQFVIAGILMEWMQHKTGSKGPSLLNIFASNNYTVYDPGTYPQVTRLNEQNFKNWPNDILLRKT